MRVSPLHPWAVDGIIEGALDVFLAQTGKADVALELLHGLLVDMNGGPSAGAAQRLWQSPVARPESPPAQSARAPISQFGRSATSRLGSTPEPGRSLRGGSAPEPGGHLSYALSEQPGSFQVAHGLTSFGVG
ncbi:MAG: hypothetical protein IPJ27_21495 [Candidatus Accumulibacter sp.]|uniref:Uncharacterized protein n=1 Tax=Candidatus Accumulibacter proximus TaxID=2954385 RepID=A0A935UIZ5_9PROT|nr:hypothetical protein [Candidatus Accumulibacter proximus]